MQLDASQIMALGVRVHPDVVTYVTVPPGVTLRDVVGDAGLDAVIATVHEPEGLSLLVPIDVADDLCGVVCSGFRSRLVSLSATTPLDGVGLTAAVSGLLAEAGIPCNMIAGHCHDHLVVPESDLSAVLEILAAGGSTHVLNAD